MYLAIREASVRWVGGCNRNVRDTNAVESVCRSVVGALSITDLYARVSWTVIRTAAAVQLISIASRGTRLSAGAAQHE